MASELDRVTIGLRDMIREGGRIATILLFWGILAAFGRYGIANIGMARPGQLFFEIGNSLALLFIVTGLTSVIIYAAVRSIQLSRR